MNEERKIRKKRGREKKEIKDNFVTVFFFFGSFHTIISIYQSVT